jgi:hypothetical protein
MSLVELLPLLRPLPRADKLRVIQVLAEDLAREATIPFEPGKAYPVWSPYDCHEAAAVLRTMLGAAEERK